jgi:DNA-binding response OmpR family regulator
MTHQVGARPVVLIIDDDAWIRSMMSEMLAAEGYAVAQADDGSAGLDLADRLQPAAILLDLALPGRSGLDVLHQLKNRHSTQDIPVLIVSAYALLMLGKDVHRADGVIQKPFDLVDLLARVNKAINTSRRGANQSEGRQSPSVAAQ